MPIISVIVPVYKVEKYIHRCVDSILAQTFADFELILVDDGSPDGCPVICDEYAAKDSRVVVIHQENGGLSAARNAGIDWAFANSDSEWLTFIDSDDWIHPQYLESLLNAAQTYGAAISVGGITRVNEWQPMDHIAITSHAEPAERLYGYFAERVVNVSATAKLYHITCFEKIRYPVGKHWEDLATTYKLILAVPICGIVEQTLYYYYNNPDGIIKRNWTPKRLDEFDAYEEQLDFLSQNPKWKEIYKNLQYSYVKAISYSYFMLREAVMPIQEKKYYEKLLSKKAREAFRKYNLHGKLRFKDNVGVYETAYPRIMNLYWHGNGLLNKLRNKR